MDKIENQRRQRQDEMFSRMMTLIVIAVFFLGMATAIVGFIAAIKVICTMF